LLVGEVVIQVNSTEDGALHEVKASSMQHPWICCGDNTLNTVLLPSRKSSRTLASGMACSWVFYSGIDQSTFDSSQQPAKICALYRCADIQESVYCTY